MNIVPKTIAVVGAGLSGLASAAVLAKQGYQVSIFEKNSTSGGRLRKFESDGFVFDMGPSWYWMPDVIEKYFNLFNTSSSEFFKLEKLDPAFRVYFGKDDYIDIPDNKEELIELFESIEPGSGKNLVTFLDESKLKYDVGVKDLVYRRSTSITEFLSPSLGLKMIKLKALKPFDKYVGSFFKNKRLKSLMEFPILFLGGTAKSTPSLYSLMNYACFELGTWYPQGGFSELAQAMTNVAEQNGVNINLSSPITDVEIENGTIKNVSSGSTKYKVDGVINGGDYHHFDQNLLGAEHRSYDQKYWDSRVMSPSSLIFYIGIDKKVEDLIHHNLFFDEDFGLHAEEIYQNPKWPSKPLFYVCCPSKTDPSVAPEGKENLFILMPLAVGIEDTEELREQYYDLIMTRLKSIIGTDLRPDVIYKKSYCIKDFSSDYNSFKGNAYGLANTTLQTAFMKPRMNSKKVNNLFHCGQLTVPGPGVPPSIISGQVAANEMIKHLSSK